MTHRDLLLRTARLERPERIPVRVNLSSICWRHYPREALFELMETHPLLFPGFDRDSWQEPRNPAWRRAGAPYVDSWGCEWVTPEDGITGAVTQHPLADWSALASFVPPDPERHSGWGAVDWSSRELHLRRAAESGALVQGGLRHGHTFLTLTYVCGYEQVLFAMVDGDPRLTDLLEMIEGFNAYTVRRLVECGVEWMGYPEDLGMQVGPMLSPNQFRAFIKPIYERLMQPARDARCVIHMHSDGDVRDLLEDLLDCGIDVLNVQDLVNGVEWLEQQVKGRVCIDLDIDRQRITQFGSAADIDRHIRDVVTRLGSREGGLMLTHGVYPGAPLANLRAVFDALERYSTYWV